MKPEAVRNPAYMTPGAVVKDAVVIHGHWVPCELAIKYKIPFDCSINPRTLRDGSHEHFVPQVPATQEALQEALQRALAYCLIHDVPLPAGSLGCPRCAAQEPPK